MSESVEQQPVGSGSVGLGIGLALIFQVICIFVSCAASPRRQLDTWLPVWGITQWILLIPLMIVEKMRGKRLTCIGILIAGAIGFLLNTACNVALQVPMWHLFHTGR